MKHSLFPQQDDEGEVLAYFGKARLVRKLDGKLGLIGGTDEDRTAAREWISMFCMRRLHGSDIDASRARRSRPVRQHVGVQG
jgi:hypothetical protein